MHALKLTLPAVELLRTAERLMAERGVDAVSLREISAAAGQKNHSAAQYYFKDKLGLVENLLLRHSLDLQRDWLRILETLRTENLLSLERLVELLVRSVAAKLDDDDGGIAFIRISAQLVAHPTIPLLERTAASTEAPLALGEAMMEFIDVPPELIMARMERVAGMMYNALASYALRPFMMEREAFLNDLMDCLVTLISSRPSENTIEALREGERGA